MTAVARPAGLAVPDGPRTAGIAAAAMAAGLATCALVVTSDHFGERAVWAVFGPLVGWSFVGAGLYARHRRSESRFGLLLALLGFAWFLAALPAAADPLVFTSGIVLGSLWGPVLAHALFSFPTGRLTNRWQRRLVFAAYAIVPLAPVPAMLFTRSDELVSCVGPCPENVLLATPDAQLGETLLGLGSALVMTLSLLVVWLLAGKWRAAGVAERRGLAPLFAAGGAALVFVVAYAATKAPALLWLAFAAFAATPFAFVGGLARADFRYSRGMRRLMGRLGELPGRADLRDALASALGDPGLSVAFWVPEQRRYVDASGSPVALPDDGDTSRAVTEVERDGARVAAIVHDRALADDREVVRAVAAAAALLLENQRLDAELRASLVELRASRVRLVEAGDAERRRLERDLHDGAQARLVALALGLRLARGRVEDGSEVATMIDASIDELKESLQELRELARGIHPAVLSERGLEPALRSLAARAPLPVELVGAPGGRLPAAVETAAYFVVAEGLTNVAKYAHARRATVRVERARDRLVVEVDDDGIGGAGASAGSGLRGLSDRVAALDGAMQLTSPPGRGTRLRVELPCA